MSTVFHPSTVNKLTTSFFTSNIWLRGLINHNAHLCKCLCTKKTKKPNKHPIVKNGGNGNDFRDTALRISPARESHSCLSVQGHLAFWKLWIGKYTVILSWKWAQIALRNTEFRLCLYRLMITYHCFEVKSVFFFFFFFLKTMDHVLEMLCDNKERNNKPNISPK